MSRAGTRRDGRLGDLEIDKPRTRLRVDQHRRRAGVLDGVGRGDERHRGDEHLVTGTDPEHAQRQDQGRRARGHTPAVRGSDVLGQHLLEPLHLGTGSDPARAQRVDHLRDLRLADQRTPEDKEIVSHVLPFG